MPTWGTELKRAEVRMGVVEVSQLQPRYLGCSSTRALVEVHTAQGEVQALFLLWTLLPGAGGLNLWVLDKGWGFGGVATVAVVWEGVGTVVVVGEDLITIVVKGDGSTVVVVREGEGTVVVVREGEGTVVVVGGVGTVVVLWEGVGTVVVVGGDLITKVVKGDGSTVGVGVREDVGTVVVGGGVGTAVAVGEGVGTVVVVGGDLSTKVVKGDGSTVGVVREGVGTVVVGGGVGTVVVVGGDLSTKVVKGDGSTVGVGVREGVGTVVVVGGGVGTVVAVGGVGTVVVGGVGTVVVVGGGVGTVLIVGGGLGTIGAILLQGFTVMLPYVQLWSEFCCPPFPGFTSPPPVSSSSLEDSSLNSVAGWNGVCWWRRQKMTPHLPHFLPSLTCSSLCRLRQWCETKDRSHMLHGNLDSSGFTHWCWVKLVWFVNCIPQIAQEQGFSSPSSCLSFTGWATVVRFWLLRWNRYPPASKIRGFKSTKGFLLSWFGLTAGTDGGVLFGLDVVWAVSVLAPFSASAISVNVSASYKVQTWRWATGMKPNWETHNTHTRKNLIWQKKKSHSHNQSQLLCLLTW